VHVDHVRTLREHQEMRPDHVLGADVDQSGTAAGDADQGDASFTNPPQYVRGVFADRVVAAYQGVVQVGRHEFRQPHQGLARYVGYLHHLSSDHATPSSFTDAVTSSAAAFTSGGACPIAMDRPAHANIDRSLPPSPITSTSDAATPRSRASKATPVALEVPGAETSTQPEYPISYANS